MQVHRVSLVRVRFGQQKNPSVYERLARRAVLDALGMMMIAVTAVTTVPRLPDSGRILPGCPTAVPRCSPRRRPEAQTPTHDRRRRARRPTAARSRGERVDDPAERRPHPARRPGPVHTATGEHGAADASVTPLPRDERVAEQGGRDRETERSRARAAPCRGSSGPGRHGRARAGTARRRTTCGRGNRRRWPRGARGQRAAAQQPGEQHQRRASRTRGTPPRRRRRPAPRPSSSGRGAAARASGGPWHLGRATSPRPRRRARASSARS